MSLNLDKSTWTRVKFGDAVANVNSTVKDAAAAGIDRVIAMEHLDPGELKIQRWGDIADGTTFTRRVKPGQTLFGKRRAYQRKVAYAEFEAICSGDILTFQANEKRLLPELLPFLVQSDGFFEHALGTSAGSLSPRTNWKDLSNFEFDLPPLHEQKRLADLLWAVEEEKLAQDDLQNVLVEIRHRAFNETASSANTATLNKWISRIDAGKSPRASGAAVKEEELGVLKVSAVGNEFFFPEENKRLLNTEDFHPDLSVRAGDILVTRANAVVDNVARPCMVTHNYPNLMLSDKTLRLVPEDEVPPRVILAALQASQYREYVREVVNGTEAKNISQQKILAGPVPDIDKQSMLHLAQQLTLFDSAIEHINQSISMTDSLKIALLSTIFGGSQ